MKVLNLANPTQSEIKFKISQFPDGQQDIVITSYIHGGIEVTNLKDLFATLPVQIKSPFNSFRDLEIIIAATKALRRAGVNVIHLYIPYLLGARSDRQFVEGGNSYLVDVIAPIINAQDYKSVTVVDVHSDVAAACIKNLKAIKNTELVKFALDSIDTKDVTLISPDAGAYKKIFDVAKEFGIKHVITANKVRDLATGNILSTEIPVDTEPGQKTFVIVDDICDGGRTFIELAKAIQAKRPKAIYNDKIYLIVTHGIFSAGFDELGKYFNGIYCTTSVKWINYPTFIKQLDVY